jgi:hypothetical protein
MPELEEREKLEEIAEGIQLAKDTAEGAVAINVAMKSR